MSARLPITVYGIRQCDTCRKALKWLGSQDLEHGFHDLRTDGLEPGLLRAWLGSDFAEKLVNRRSTTWRQLSEQDKSATGEALIALLLVRPTLVKRPVFMLGDEILAVGFDPAALGERLGVSAN